ncbi:MAG: FecR family protein [Mangrovibacterium sp.]
MENHPGYKTLFEFAKGKYSYKDYLKVKYWFTEVRDDKETEKRMFDQWKDLAKAETGDPASLHSLFEKIQYQILLEEKMNEKKNLWHWYRQIAAILIPLMVVSMLVYFLAVPVTTTDNQAWVELNAPEGGRIEFLLPDSTSGWLNGGAKLKYPPVFGRHRKVELIGEAFFNVSHRESSDFTVSISNLDIRVLGTKFNVSAYSDDESSEVVLEQGRVEVKGRTSRFTRTLLPDEKLTYNDDMKSFRVTSVEAALYTAWTDGYLVIDNEQMEQVARKLERWYNVEISIEDETLKGLRFKGTFNGEPIDEVLRFIAMTTPVSYSIERNGYHSNGTLKKRHVTMKLK